MVSGYTKKVFKVACQTLFNADESEEDEVMEQN